MLLLNVSLRRSLHTGSIRLQFVKDVYKKIDYRVELKDKRLDTQYKEFSQDIVREEFV